MSGVEDGPRDGGAPGVAPERAGPGRDRLDVDRGGGAGEEPDHARAVTPATGSVWRGTSTSGLAVDRTRGSGWRDEARAFTTAARLAWQMEANWTDPFLFFIYSVAKPVATALIFVFMLEVISGPQGRALRGFVVVGTALWSLVMGGMAGLAWSLLDDRERYRMLKYLYVSPSDFTVVFVGRGMARLAVGAMGAVITLAIGIAILGVPLEPARIDWPLLFVSMVLGMIAIVALGMVLAAICLQTRQEAWSYPEAAAGALFLVVGAVFPLAVLPWPAQAIGILTPTTWWLEGVRQALFPSSVSAVGGEGSLWHAWTGQAAPDRPEILIALLATTALGTLAAAASFRWSERRARDRGLIDMTTGS